MAATATDHASTPPVAPRQQLSLLDSTSIIVGIIIGSGIYRSSPDIAAGAGRYASGLASRWGLTSPGEENLLAIFILAGVWVAGALIALVGGLCYAELGTSFPQAGGTYVYLSEAFGRTTGFAFAWVEFWIVRPGNVGAMAFVMASYARPLIPASGIPPHTTELLLAVAAIVAITILNALGLQSGKWTQNVLTAAKVVGLAAIIVAACAGPPGTDSRPLPTEPWKTLSLSLIFVMFAYGGWADMSYVAEEVRHPERNILRALVLGILAVAAIYLAITFAFVWSLGLRGLASAQAVAADVMELRIGPLGATAISLLVIVSCLGSMNGTIFTGARVYYALGTRHPGFRWLGVWDAGKGIPLRSLIVQSAATIGLTIAVGFIPGGFERLVTFTTPFFFGFTALVGVAVFLLRGPKEHRATVFRAPLFPLTPLLFILSSCAMVYASLDYAARNPAREALWAVAVVVTGLVAGLIDWRQRTAATSSSSR